jgi:hypothetical protein
MLVQQVVVLQDLLLKTTTENECLITSCGKTTAFQEQLSGSVESEALDLPR